MPQLNNADTNMLSIPFIASCNCNGHGTCATISTMHATVFPATYDAAYALWDKNQTTSCICDIGKQAV